MSKFDEIGFLAEDNLDFMPALEARYGKYIEICKELNTYSQKLQYELVVHNKHLPELLSSILFSRVLSTYQAALLVSFKGMRQQVIILIRCILEPLFPLVAISKDHTFSHELVKAEEVERLNELNKLIRYKERNNIDVAELAQLKAKKIIVTKNNKKNNLKKISVFDCAKKSGLEDWYYTLYAFTSSTLHSSVRSLEEALHLDPTREEIIALKYEPESEGFDDLYITLSECLMHAISSICSIFDLNEPEIIEDCRRRVRKLEGNFA
ncbi:MAG: hypothetical protein JYX80_13760 [Candidatus Scalindua sediminis]|nr:hypothetical protein [Candidatus Scalindua sediminis]